jgi:hypothetical protein
VYELYSENSGSCRFHRKWVEEKWERDGLREPELLAWIARFRQDKWQAARDFGDG